MVTNKKRKEYFQDFFNNNFLREFRLLSENRYNNNRLFIKSHTEKAQSTLLNKILYYDNGNTNIYGEIYGFKDWKQYKKQRYQINHKKTKKQTNQDKPIRVYDRLYFDFDFDKNPKTTELKESINHTIKTNDKASKKELIKKYHDILLNDKTALKPFEELQILYDYLKNKGIMSYPVFSGSKGFHLYIFFQSSLFDPISFNNIAYGMFKGLKNELELETLDKAVFENPTQRIARLPYCKHPITELYCYPININNPYNEIIENSFNPKITPLDIAKHINNKGNIELLDTLKLHITKEDKKQAQLEKLEFERKKLQKNKNKTRYKKYGNKKFKEVEKNCIRIANEFLGSPSRTYSNYVTYICPFHNDNKPSLSVYQHRFYCAVCNDKLNYLDFIMKYKGVDEKEGIKILLNTF